MVFLSTLLFGEREFTRSARMYLSNGKKKQEKGEKKRENETGERSFQQESFSATARAEIGVTVTPWPTSFFRVRRMDRKRRLCMEGNGVGETTPSFVITV